MRRASSIGALAVGTALFVQSPVADACGDKLLSIARGIRLHQAYQARHPASILLYVGDLSAAESSKRERNRLVQLSILYMSLRQAGHELQVAQNDLELDEALRAGQFDFVMTDPRDVNAVAIQIAGVGSATELVPVLFKPKKTDFAAARTNFKLVLKTPATSVDHLEAIDDAMESARAATAGY